MSSTTKPKPNSDDWKVHLCAVSHNQDKDAFRALYLHFAPKIKAFYASHGLTNKSEEMTHEVFMKIWQKAKTYNPEKAAVATWIFTIVRNLRIDYLRKKRIEETSEEEPVLTSSEPGPDEELQADRSRSSLLSNIDLLDDEQRHVIQKVYFEDKSHSDVAKELEMTLGTVKSRVRSALKIMRSQMGGKEI
ncbi:RNA polymerase sigma factor [Aliikangiella sp. G2MR2-5]|uniref:RNA polymerase sigma factor n=1 Tax=Aliikangiella sp. G2MR2-5 TaxID=2788943 RepID=UPI001AED7FE5|nr:sigma-70 family RNA polymerase sigma factor [Aliikangiella sp. G2MR2-5]